MSGTDGEQKPLWELDPSYKKPSANVRRTVDAYVQILDEPPDEISFLHSTLCQVALPRSDQKEKLRFERRSGHSTIWVEAGALAQEGRPVQQPLPYGPKPRLILIHICTEAKKNKSPVVDVGRSAHAFMRRLGLQTTGPDYAMLKKQILALAASRITLFHENTTIDAKLVHRFEAWLTKEDRQSVMWGGVVELSKNFYDSLEDHSVPLDPRALHVLSDTAMGLDQYVWLAGRLHRIRQPRGILVSWVALHAQFGQEYKALRSFKQRFREALNRVEKAYPEAKVELTADGLWLMPSKPPVPKIIVSVPLSLPPH